MSNSHPFTRTVLTGLLITGLFATHAFAARDVKQAAEVFVYAAEFENNQIIINWDIEPGYYLYRDKLSFSTTTPGVVLGEATSPPGEIHADEFFGEQRVFRDAARVIIPLLNKPKGTQQLELLIRSQGCADYGLCYPPQDWTATIKLPSKPVFDLRPVLALQQSDAPIPVTEAFRPHVSTTDPFTLTIRWDIEPGYYLYRDSFGFQVQSEEVQLGTPRFPDGIMQEDLEFGDTEVYYYDVTIRLPLSRASPEPQLIELELAYQGCKQGSICYPPEKLLVPIELPLATEANAAERSAPVSEQSRLAGVISSAGILSLMSVFLGMGLLLSFTPCCLPMVPILSSIIAGQGESITTLRAFGLSLSYVLGMAFTYTLAGALFGAAGTQIQAALQTPVIVGGVALLFVVLAIAMFGAVKLQLPASLQTRLTSMGNQQKAGSFIGVAIMGAISALVVTTCVAPPLVAALTVMAQTGDVLRGALALFAMAIGMGIPLLVIGTSAGKLLPKAGPWMQTINAAFGCMMLALAIWMLSRIIPATFTMGLYAALALGTGIRFGALSALPRPATGSSMLGKGIALVMLIYGATLVVGLLSGASNPLQPLARISGAPATKQLNFERIKSVADFEAVRNRAAASGVPLMLDFYADWCVSCIEMEHYTFSDPRVQTVLQNAILVQADVTANDASDKALLAHFGIFGPPTIVFFDRQGREIPDTRIIGFQSAEEFLTHLEYVLR